MLTPSLQLCEAADLAYEDPDLAVGNVQARFLRRDGALLFSYAGSNDLMDWCEDCMAFPVPRDGGRFRMEKGFADMFDTIAHATDIALQGVTDPIDFTGHSAGGPLAFRAAERAFRAGLKVRQVQVFGCPMFGNDEWAKIWEATGIPALRVVHGQDGVPALPGASRGYVYECETLILDGNGKPLTSQGLPPDWEFLSYLADTKRDHPMPGYLKAVRLF